MTLSTYRPCGELPLTIEKFELERLELQVSSSFRRVTTVVHLHGEGVEGVGEDVTYEADDHDRLREHGSSLELAGRYSLTEYSRLLDSTELFPTPPISASSTDFRRWAFESAGLDLALRQAGTNLADVLGRSPKPVRFVVSLRVEGQKDLDRNNRLRLLHPSLQFKLDPVSAWDQNLMNVLAVTGAVVVLDLKGAYHGTPVDQPPDPELYRRVLKSFPEVWIEDPALVPETESLFADCRERVTWDAPIHSIADIESLSFRPKVLNFKPSRFGTLESLFNAYDYCASQWIQIYGG